MCNEIAPKRRKVIPEKEELVLSSYVRLPTSFFSTNTNQLACNLLGKLIVRKLSDSETLLIVRIVETESYPGVTDPASHSFNGRRTARTEAMFMMAGTVYVYSIYGQHVCVNVSSSDKGGAVLIRAVEPVQGVEEMTLFRNTAKKVTTVVLMKNTSTKKTSPASVALRSLCNGPSKLCQAMAITKSDFNQIDSSTSNDLFFADDGYIVADEDVVNCSRIGLSNPKLGEARTAKLRYFIRDNKFVSVKSTK